MISYPASVSSDEFPRYAVSLVKERYILTFSLLTLIAIVVSLPFFKQQQQTKQYADTITPSVNPISAPLVWPAFDGGGSRSGNFSQETVSTTSNVSGLKRIWKQSLPYKSNGSPVYASAVITTQGVKDLVFWTTQKGSLVAIDAATGSKIWQADTTGQFIESQGTSSSPAIDPTNQFIYSYGLDGKVHKYAIGTGVEQTTGNFPVTVTLHTSDEKESSPLNIGNGYLYVTISGYNGDFGNYVGHVVGVNLATGTVSVFNSLCSNTHQLLSDTGCSSIQSGIWARGGAVIDPVTNNVFVSTGNGPFGSNAAGFNYGDTIIELSPDLSQVIDTYTPSNYSTLNSQDEDLGSAAPVMLPQQTNTNTPYLAVQGGKDLKVRLLNRQNLSGAGGPTHVGGELQSISVSCQILSHAPVWQDASGTTWIFVSDTCNNFYAFKVVNANNASSLQLVYKKTGITTSGFISGGVLFGQASNVINAFNPSTGALLWQSSQSSAGGTVGALHWQSPIAINGRLFTADDAGSIYAYSLPNLPTGTSTPTLTATSTPGATVTLTPTPTIAFTPTLTPTGSLGQVVLSNLSVKDTTNAKYWSFQTNMQIGNTLYGDRTYTISSVPSSLVGSSWIRTANASKSYTSDPLVTFSINQTATVYVGFDTRATKPSWVDSSWTNSGLQFTDSEPVSFIFYQKTFPAGTVSLGHNATQTSGVNMYTVIVK